MRRAYGPLELRIDGKTVRTTHVIGWTKPGTVLDRVVKAQQREQLYAAYAKYGVPHGMRKPTGNREKARYYRRTGGVMASAVSGHVYDGQ